jgi:Protein of unknown function (DUF1552)
MSRFVLNRRLMLQSAVASIALPRLDAMLNGNGVAYADGTALPKRFGVFFWGLGNDAARWTPAGTGTNWALSEQLMPFAPVKEYLSVATGFKLQPIVGQVHVGGSVGILTGDGANVEGFEVATVKRPSIDQLVAAHLGSGSKLKSIEARSSNYLHLPAQGGSAIDWSSHSGPNAPNKAELDPKVVFNRLFGSAVVAPGASEAELARINAGRKSVLDQVRRDAARLEKRVGSRDRARLQQHLEGIRSIELQLAAVPPPTNRTCVVPTAPGDLMTGEIRARNKVMSQLLAMAFACDVTRVATLQLSGGGTHDQFPDVGVNFDTHEIGHVQGINADINKAIIFWMECFAVWLKAMKDLTEGAGNVLDSSCLFGTSDHGYAPQHGYDEFPLLIGGKAQGALRGGVHVRSVGSVATRVPFTLMKAMGMKDTSFGQEHLMTSSVVSELLV